MTSEEKGFLAAIKKDPDDATARGAYADWLDEHGRRHDAMLQRSAAGLSEIRRKTDGLFSEGAEGRHAGKVPWTTKGKMWPTMAHLRSHLNSEIPYYSRSGRKKPYLYQRDTPLSDLEVIVVELRFVVGARMALAVQFDQGYKTRASVKITELDREEDDESKAQ